MSSHKKGCVLSFLCAFCGVRIKMFEVQGQACLDDDRTSALGMKPHVCQPKRRSGYERRTGIDVIEHR